MMTLTELRAFVAVARKRHFTQAALELSVSQSAVSYHLRELERSLRVKLVEVVGHRVFLTEAGHRLFERATALLNDLEDIEREIRDIGVGLGGSLRLGATHTVGSYALPSVLASFRAARPNVEIQLIIDNVRAIERLLLDRVIDLAVVEWPVLSSDLNRQVLRTDALVLIGPPNHPLAARDRVNRSELKGQTFVLRERGSGIRALGEELLGPTASEVVVAMELNEPEAVVRAVEAGMGLAFISLSIVERQLSAGSVRVIPLAGVDLGHVFSLVTVRDRVASVTTQLFCDHLIAAWRAPDIGSEASSR